MIYSANQLEDDFFNESEPALAPEQAADLLKAMEHVKHLYIPKSDLKLLDERIKKEQHSSARHSTDKNLPHHHHLPQQ